MAVKTFNPQCEVLITPENSSEDFSLTGAVKNLRVMRGMQGFQNSFSISLLPIRDTAGVSWYHKITPGNYVDIRYCRYPENWKSIPSNFRGFVEHVNKNIAVDGRGRPQRSYSIGGRDVISRLLNITWIYYLLFTQFALARDPASGNPAYALNQKYSIPFAGKPQEVLTDIFGVAKVQLEALRKTYPSLPSIDILTSDQIRGEVHLFSAQQHDGSIASLMSFFDNYPWNELYSANFLENPTLIFRQAPWKDPISGELIQGDDSTYATTLSDPIEIEPSQIISVDLMRSDNEVKNYYFTYPQQGLLDEAAFQYLAAHNNNDMEHPKGNPYRFDLDDEYAGEERFGYRYQQMAIEYLNYSNSDNGEERSTFRDTAMKLCDDLNTFFAKASHHNVAYESGAFVLQGNELIQPGKYLKFGDAEYYVVSVRDDLSFMAGGEYFRTTAHVIRGTDYIKTKMALQQAREGAEIKSLRAISGRY